MKSQNMQMNALLTWNIGRCIESIQDLLVQLYVELFFFDKGCISFIAFLFHPVSELVFQYWGADVADVFPWDPIDLSFIWKIVENMLMVLL